MKPLALLIVPCLAATAWAGQVQRTARVLLTHRGPETYRAFRVEDECYVPLDAVSAWGWNLQTQGDRAEIRAEGETFTVPVRMVENRQTIPLRVAVNEMGGSTEWVLNTNRIEVYAPLRSVQVQKGRIEIQSPLTLRPTVAQLANPNRVVVELPGARLVRRTKRRLDRGVHLSQVSPNVVRVEMEVPFRPQLPPGIIEPTRHLELEIGPAQGVGDNVPPELPPIRDPASGDRLSTLEPPVQPTNKTASPLVSGPLAVKVELEGPLATVLTIRSGSGVVGNPVLRKPAPDVLEIVLPGAALELPRDFALNTPSVNSVATRTNGGSTVLTITLPRPMGAQVSTTGGVIRVELLKPPVGNGRLSGKIVVVDPGHGGRAGGATRAGVMEKTLTLAIGKLIAADLAEQGATVIMTRKTDVDVSLNERAAIATRNGAHFFLSVHINSTARDNTTRGSITFHHKGSVTSKLLAECIHREIAKVSKLPSLGVWSDGRVYDSGFAVLRKTKMPGVLLELGFINHNRDRARMLEPQFQRAVAAAVVKGVRVFLGDVEPSK